MGKQKELRKFAKKNQIASKVLQDAREAYDNREHRKNLVIIVLAVTAWEHYGPNDNGDAFYEDTYSGVIFPDETLLSRYVTFDDSGSNVYRFHASSDASNKVGNIHSSFYNREQHRVELVIEIDWDGAREECIKLRDGRALNVSMGCSVPYDICSVCGNKATTEDEYCEHIKYHLMDIVDGKPVFMINVRPSFYDISFVLIGGDINAKTMYMVNKGNSDEDSE